MISPMIFLRDTGYRNVTFSYTVSETNKLLVPPKGGFVYDYSPADRISLCKKFEMVLFNHYHIFNTNMKQPQIDCTFFLWSHLGILLLSFLWALYTRDSSVLKGVY